MPAPPMSRRMRDVDDAIITVDGLRHRYGDFPAVDGISFTIGRGEIFSFLGPNGAGKSTAINVLTTLLRIQEGTVKIAGHDLASDPQGVREDIGIVFQEVTLDRDLTVAETLEFHGRLYGLTRAERAARIAELLDLVELAGWAKVRTKRLSGGMKRRLEIARGLMTRPIVLFLDEPTIGLDPQTRLRMWDYLQAVNREGTTIFLTTHYMDEADRLSDRVAIIDHGKIIAEGTPLSLKNALGEDIIMLCTGDDPAAEAVIRGMEGITGVKTDPTGLTLLVAGDGTHVLPVVMHRLEEEGITVISVNLKKPSMDDVFVHFTGRKLRDNSAGEGH
jgi:ABC-2 type transport system ATP-binding protein